MEVGNYVMLTFILLLIHDLRHDFNYKRWNKKIITFINKTEKLRVDLFKYQSLKGGCRTGSYTVSTRSFS